MTPDGFAIQSLGVSKTYGRAGAVVHALRDVSFDVRPGERIALLGKSGSGKSTLLNLLGGLDAPTSGRVLLNGRDLATLSADERARHRREAVGLVFQSYHLVPSQSALQNVEMPLLFRGDSPRERRRAAAAMLAAVGLSHRARHRPSELSGGERQRVALARALISRPSILLADEPTGNLDSSTADEVLALVNAQLAAHAMTLVVVTHDEELARTFAQRVLRLQDGQLI